MAKAFAPQSPRTRGYRELCLLVAISTLLACLPLSVAAAPQPGIQEASRSAAQATGHFRKPAGRIVRVKGQVLKWQSMRDQFFQHLFG